MVKFPQPKPLLRKFFELPFAYDFPIAIFACCGGMANAKRAFHANEDFAGYLWTAAAVGVFLFTSIKIAIQWSSHSEATSTHALEGCLHVLHALMTDGIDDGIRVRATVHAPVEKRQKLLQILNYVGDTTARQTAGRRFAAQSGIIGEAMRQNKMCVGDRENDNYEAYIDELVGSWHYTEEDAKKVDPASMAWMAMPLTMEDDPNTVEAVVYLDATRRKFFDERRQELGRLACGGIARFVKGRYK